MGSIESDTKHFPSRIDDASIRIGGVEIQYYFTCHRELWFKLQQISPPQDDTNIAIGKQIHERSYSNRTRREITVGSAKVDLVISKKAPKIIEIKKSSKLLLPTKRQLQYYLWLLERQGIKIQGEIRVPKEKKIISVSLDDNSQNELRQAINGIHQIAMQDIPPPYKKKPFCRSCAYRPICEV